MKKVAVFLCGAFFFLGMPFLVSAQEENAIVDSAGQSMIIADVNVRNASIVKQDEEKIDLKFTLKNGTGAQPDIRYSVDLLNLGGISQYQKIYGDNITLAQDSSVDKEVSFEAPDYLFGDYELWLRVKNGDGMSLSSAKVGIVNFTNFEAQFIDIQETSCKLGIKGSADQYALRQGVDVSSDEELVLSCVAKSSFGRKIDTQVSINTFKRSAFGDSVGTENSQQTIIFNPRETKRIDITIPKPKDPQAYEVAFNLTENNKIISPTIYAHYVVQGNSASIVNAQLDKANYAAGEKAKISFLWALAADSFEDSRSGKKSNETAYYDLKIKNNKQEDCITPISRQALDGGNGMEEKSIDIIRNCPDPKVLLSITDEKGKVLAEKGYDFKPTSNDAGVAKNNPNIEDVSAKKDKLKNIIQLMIFILVLLSLVALLVYSLKNRSVKLLVFLLLGSSLFFTARVSAMTLGGAQSGYFFSCDFDMSSDTVAPGGVLDVNASDCVSTYCSNAGGVGVVLKDQQFSGDNLITDQQDGRKWTLVSRTWQNQWLEEDYYAFTRLTGTDCWDNSWMEYGSSGCATNHDLAVTSAQFDTAGDCQDDFIDYAHDLLNNSSCESVYTARYNAGWYGTYIDYGEGNYSFSQATKITGSEYDYCAYVTGLSCKKPQAYTNRGTTKIQAPATCGTNIIPIAVGLERGVFNRRFEGVLNYATVGCATNGACGTRSREYTAAETVTDWQASSFCANGIAGTVQFPNGAINFPAPGTTTANWSCMGRDGGTDVTDCHASRQSLASVPGVCGTKSREYTATETVTDWQADTWCSEAGMIQFPNGQPAFPNLGVTTVNWTCAGKNGGTDVTNCHASRQAAACSPTFQCVDTADVCSGKCSQALTQTKSCTSSCAGGGAVPMSDCTAAGTPNCADYTKTCPACPDASMNWVER